MLGERREDFGEKVRSKNQLNNKACQNQAFLGKLWRTLTNPKKVGSFSPPTRYSRNSPFSELLRKLLHRALYKAMYVRLYRALVLGDVVEKI